ncbi:MAG: glycosyltransferase family 2 protein [Deltaproteobacteria bacterium]|nr:glycosyltransferase family 2 protein [Deltaproteobacteria bacterium]
MMKADACLGEETSAKSFLFRRIVMEQIRKLADRLLVKLQSAGKDFNVEPDQISIGITTFGNRFDRYFKPLVSRIREYAPDSEVIVAVNGEHRQPFDENYRRRVLEFISLQPNVFPIVFPRFRGLSKLWNSIVIHAGHDHILMLNDDIMINKAGFFKDICGAIKAQQGRTFLINQSWSHFLLSRTELDELGYFDERLLGIGEEDGDMVWRYIRRYGHPIANVRMKGIVNFAEETVKTYKPANIQTHSGTKYSLFNRRFMFSEKYGPSPDGVKGMFDEPVVLKDPGSEQYPNESFYRRRKDEL